MAQRATVGAALGGMRLTMTYDQWLDWASESALSEWVNGEVVVHMPPNIPHANVSIFLSTLIKMFVEPRELGAVYAAPVEMRLIPGALSREPDLLFVASANLHRVTDLRVDGPADLVIEIVSPGSVKRDYDTKRREYEAAGVREFWLFDARPGKFRAEFRQLGADGRYRLVPPDADGRYHSLVIPEFWLRPDWLRQQPLPAVRACLTAIEATA